MINTSKPTQAFTFAAWAALFVGSGAYLLGLFNAGIELSEKGYFLICLFFGLYSAISLQKTVRDRLEDIPVTEIYYNISWIALASAVVLLLIGLWNADIALNEKGFFLLGFTLCLFAAITVQKNTRDTQKAKSEDLLISQTFAPADIPQLDNDDHSETNTARINDI